MRWSPFCGIKTQAVLLRSLSPSPSLSFSLFSLLLSFSLFSLLLSFSLFSLLLSFSLISSPSHSPASLHPYPKGYSNSPLDPSKSYALGVTGHAFSLLVPDRVEESQGEDLAELYLREGLISFLSSLSSLLSPLSSLLSPFSSPLLSPLLFLSNFLSLTLSDNLSFSLPSLSHSTGKSSPSLLLHLLLHQGAVFARMKPEQKALLVEHMISMGYTTAMVGDGANDCQSLKAAEVREREGK